MLDLPAYRDLLRGSPLPTPEQIADFAHHLGQAHSWYKHLPLMPPGAPFQIYLDPAAGMDIEVDRDGRAMAVTRARGPHYSTLATDDYRARFGLLNWRRVHHPTLAALDGAESVDARRTDLPAVFHRAQGRCLTVPQGVASAGTTWMSGAIYPTLSIDPKFWLFPTRQNPDLPWPEANGGMNGMRKLREHVEWLSESLARVTPLPKDDPRVGDKYYLQFADFELHQLLLPERERQLRGIEQAARRVIALVAER